MSRTIKFRAWDKKNDYYADYEDIEEEITAQAIDGWRSEDGGTSFTLDYGIKDFELEQYTGLKDKNGKEIYEGDILEFTKDPVQAVVIWNRPHAEFQIKWLDCKVEDSLSWHLHDHGGAEVIGNIHENPELIGGEE